MAGTGRVRPPAATFPDDKLDLEVECVFRVGGRRLDDDV